MNRADTWAIGRFTVGDENVFWESSRAERTSAAAHASRVLQAHGIGCDDKVVIVSLNSEAVQLVPVEDAVRGLGGLGAPVDATPRDAARLESLLRQFDVHTVLGVRLATIDGLAELGHPCSILASVEVVMAYPDATEALRGAGVQSFLWLPLGPTVALECPARQGAHVDGSWWDVAVVDGSIVLRHADNVAVATGVRGTVDSARCECGNDEPRVRLA